MTNYMNLEKIANMKKWQRLQDSVARATKMAIITVNYKGMPITRHSSPRPFCQYVRNQPDLERRCHKCDSRGGLEAARTNAPYIYRCHCNIIDLAIPIIVDDKYVGATMAGQIRLPESEEDLELERMLTTPSSQIFSSLEVIQLYEAIPILSLKEIQESALMLFEMYGYIVEEAMSKNLILELHEKIAVMGQVAPPVSVATPYSIYNIVQAKKAMEGAFVNAYIQSSDTQQPISKNPLLRPAFDYIYQHKGESVTQAKMAALCHISTSHFSRIFSKETGESFSKFVAHLKVEWSKQFLEKTDISITQISDELGFSDCGYYIKTFKKFEGITPSAYRKYYAK